MVLMSDDGTHLLISSERTKAPSRSALTTQTQVSCSWWHDNGWQDDTAASGDQGPGCCHDLALSVASVLFQKTNYLDCWWLLCYQDYNLGTFKQYCVGNWQLYYTIIGDTSAVLPWSLEAEVWRSTEAETSWAEVTQYHERHGDTWQHWSWCSAGYHHITIYWLMVPLQPNKKPNIFKKF